MSAQLAIVTMLVIGCTTYAAWTLMPKTARRAIARTLLRLSLPSSLAAVLQRQLAPDSACGCDGCDLGTKKPDQHAAVQPISFHPRIRR